MLSLLVAGVLLATALWLISSQQRSAFVLLFFVASNASPVLEFENGLPGTLLPLSLAIIAAAAWQRVTRGPAHPPSGLRTAAILVCFGAIVLSALIGPFISTDPFASNAAVGLLLKHLIVFVAVVVVSWTPAGLLAGLAGVAAAGLFLAVITIGQALLGSTESTVFGFGWWTSETIGGLGAVSRAAGPFGSDPNAFAQYLTVAFAVSLGFALTMRGRRRWPWMVAAGASVVAVLLTASRTGLLATGAVTMVALIMRGLSRRSLVIVAAAAFVVAVGPFGVSTRLSTLSAVPNVAESPANADSGLVGRASEMIAAGKMFADNPMTGVGYGTYNSFYLDYSRQIGLDDRFEERSAHSLPLEIAAEQGLIGLVPWASFLVLGFGSTRRLIGRRTDIAVPLGLAQVGFLASAVFLHDVHPRLLWSLMAMTVAATVIADRSRTTRVRPGPLGPGSRVRVAMVIQGYVPAVGGAERQLASLMPGLVRRGVEPLVITRCMAGRPANDEVDGVPVMRIRVKGVKILRSLMFVAGARSALRRFDPHVVHAFDTLTPSTIALGHGRVKSTPVVTKVLRSGVLGDLHRLAQKPFGQRRRQRLVDNVDMFVAISHDIDAELAAIGVDEQRRILIPNGVDTERFRPAVRPPSTKPPYTVVATGRLAPEKRLVELAQRWPAVQARHPGTRLVIAGEGPCHDALADCSGIELLGRRDDVENVLANGDLYVSASTAEGLSNSLLEAMAGGLACVVTDVGGVRDVITGPEEGVVVDADDLDLLVEELCGLLGDAKRRGRMGRAARDRVKSSFSLEVTAERLAALYHTAASGAAHEPGTTTEGPSTTLHRIRS